MAMTRTYYAYIHRRPDGVPFYVGKGSLRRAKYLGERNAWHKSVVEKYGRKNIIITMIRCATEQSAFAVEVALIRSYRMAGISLCNYTDGGEGTSNPVPETRQRISEAAKKRGISKATREAVSKAKKGVLWTAEQRNRLSECVRRSWQTRVLTDEQREHLSAAAKKRGVSDATRAASRAALLGSTLGPRTDETKAKISVGNKGKVRSLETRKLLSIVHKANPTRYWLGKKRDPETKAKISASLRRNALEASYA